MSFPLLKSSDDSNFKLNSSIDQFKGFLSVWTRGGYTPIVFDSLDGITCETVHTHPIIISYNDELGYKFSDAECTYASDLYVYYDHQGVEEYKLPEWFGGSGEFYDKFVKSNSFVNFEHDSLGVHNDKSLRVGTSYYTTNEILPPVE